jgi:hypothetical protein
MIGYRDNVVVPADHMMTMLMSTPLTTCILIVSLLQGGGAVNLSSRNLTTVILIVSHMLVRVTGVMMIIVMLISLMIMSCALYVYVHSYASTMWHLVSNSVHSSLRIAP